MKFCQKCGKELMDEAVICPSCGCPQSAAKPVAATSGAVAGQPKTRKGTVIAAGITLGISLIFLGVFLKQYIVIMTSGVFNGKALTYAGLWLYTVTLGWVSIIPGFALNIATICTSAQAMKSPVKAIKTTGIVFFVCSMIILVGLIVAYVIPAASLTPLGA